MSDPTTDPPVVLIVEDEVDLADLYALWLRDDYEVRTAYDGETALDLLDENVSVVLLDRRMPGLSGDEVLESIRERAYDCRVAMVTAVQPDIDIVEMGFDDYVSKPVFEDELKALVDRLVSLSAYDRDFRTYYTLLSKRIALENRMPTEALANSSEYDSLVADVEELRTRLDDTLAELDEEELEVLFRTLGSE